MNKYWVSPAQGDLSTNFGMQTSSQINGNTQSVILVQRVTLQTNLFNIMGLKNDYFFLFRSVSFLKNIYFVFHHQWKIRNNI
jgi:hypothetical protein